MVLSDVLPGITSYATGKPSGETINATTTVQNRGQRGSCPTSLLQSSIPQNGSKSVVSHAERVRIFTFSWSNSEKWVRGEEDEISLTEGIVQLSCNRLNRNS